MATARNYAISGQQEQQIPARRHKGDSSARQMPCQDLVHWRQEGYKDKTTSGHTGCAGWGGGEGERENKWPHTHAWGARKHLFELYNKLFFSFWVFYTILKTHECREKKIQFSVCLAQVEGIESQPSSSGAEGSVIRKRWMSKPTTFKERRETPTQWFLSQSLRYINYSCSNSWQTNFYYARHLSSETQI